MFLQFIKCIGFILPVPFILQRYTVLSVIMLGYNNNNDNNYYYVQVKFKDGFIVTSTK